MTTLFFSTSFLFLKLYFKIFVVMYFIPIKELFSVDHLSKTLQAHGLRETDLH